MHSPERANIGAEKTVEVQEAAQERLETLRKTPENSQETHENQAEEIRSARVEAKSIFAKEAGQEKHSDREPSVPSIQAIRNVTKIEKQKAFKKTLARAQQDMRLPSRTFSKVIHHPLIEQSSELIGNTIARPNAIIFGSATAIIVSFVMYMVAMTYGYTLSGFEIIGSYVIGWIFGLIIDYARNMIITNR